MNRLRYSIITVCLNAQEHLEASLASVLAQQMSDFEYLIVDGGSVDGTLDIVRAYESRLGGRLHCVSEPDDGLYEAMNKGLRRASGEFVEFLGAGDRLLPDTLERVDETVSAGYPDIVCGATRVFGPKAEWVEPARPKIRRGLAQRAPARHQSIFVRRQVLLETGGFDPRYRIAADYDVYLKLRAAGCSEVLVDSVLSEFMFGGVSSTRILATARDYRDVRVAHGADRMIEELVMWKSALGAALHTAWKRPT